MGNTSIMPFVKYDLYWSVQTKSRTADYTYDIRKKVYFMNLRKYSNAAKRPTNIIHSFVLNFVKI